MSRLTDPQDAQEWFDRLNLGNGKLGRHADDEAYGTDALATNLRESVRRHVEIQENDQIYPVGQVIKAYCEILDIRFQALFIKAGEDHWHQTGNEDCVTWHDLLDWLSGDHVVAYDLAVDWHSVWSR